MKTVCCIHSTSLISIHSLYIISCIFHMLSGFWGLRGKSFLSPFLFSPTPSLSAPLRLHRHFYDSPPLSMLIFLIPLQYAMLNYMYTISVQWLFIFYRHNITKERKSELCKELQKMVKGKAKEVNLSIISFLIIW